jgi:acyl-CoA thioester hydrolase
MSGGFLSYRGAVYPWQCDHMGHMNVMWYVGKFDEATWNFFAELGLTRAYLQANGRGMAAVEQVIQYKKELMAGDTVAVHSAVVDIKEKVLRFRHEMRNTQSGEVAATTALTAVFLGYRSPQSRSFSSRDPGASREGAWIGQWLSRSKD